MGLGTIYLNKRGADPFMSHAAPSRQPIVFVALMEISRKWR